ncbi:Ceramide glucosyltransferase [Microbotryomycetes sp. JL221]|nr:Ceramide glucosyltransferase [Microbotryomycetes sp. JL221]
MLGELLGRTRYNGKSLEATVSSSPTGSSPRHDQDSEDDSGVTIIRPLRGLDTNLYENLEASFLQRYPKFEILFSVAEDHDPAVAIVQQLLDKYPHIDARLVIGQDTSVVNPKIRNMLLSYKQAKYDILWVLDSNVLTSVYTLANSVKLLTQRPRKQGARQIGLVHHLPFAIYPDQQLGSRVEQVFLCSTHAKMYLAINAVAVASCVTGKSCLYRKSDLERAAEKKRQASEGAKRPLADKGDGLAAFGQYLGEDNMIGEAIWDDLGLRHCMGGDIAGNAVGSMTFNTYFRRRVRWIRVRKYMVIASTLVEPFTECFLSGLVSLSVIPSLLGLPRWLFLAIHVTLWYLLDITIYKYLLRSSPAASTRTNPPAHDGPSFSYLKAWLVRESMALPIWLFAMGGNTVGWRDGDNRYRVLRDGRVGFVDDTEPESIGERLLERGRRLVGEKQYVTLRPDDVEEGRNGVAQ